jgi:hypothetical protein
MRGGFPHEQRQNHCCQVGRRVAAAARIRQEREGDLKPPREVFESDLKWASQRISSRHAETVTEPGRLYVLQLNHARLPNTSATKEGGCALVQRGWIAHPLWRAAMPWNIYSLFGALVWT